MTIVPMMTNNSITIYYNLMNRGFTNGLGDQSLIPGRAIPKTKKKMVLDAALLNTQHYEVRIKGKVKQFRE